MSAQRCYLTMLAMENDRYHANYSYIGHLLYNIKHKCMSYITSNPMHHMSVKEKNRVIGPSCSVTLLKEARLSSSLDIELNL